MSPNEEERARDIKGLISAVAALQAGERHAAEDRELIRGDLHATERRILDKVAEVDRHCEQRFKDAAQSFNVSLSKIEQGLSTEKAGRRSVTVAWIGGAFLLIASIINSIAALSGGGP